MIKNLLILMLLGSSGYYFYQNQSLQASLEEAKAKVGQEETEVQALAKKVKQENLDQQRLQLEKQNQQKAAADLLNAEKEKLKQLEAQQASLKHDLALLSNSSQLDQQLKDMDQSIHALEQQLSGYKSGEKYIDQNKGVAIKLTQEQKKAALDEMNSAIRKQQALVQATQKKLNLWKTRTRDLSQPTRIEELEPELAQEQEDLDNLQEKKTALQNTEVNQKMAISAQANEEKMRLDIAQNAIQDEIKQIKQDEASLKDKKSHVQTSRSDLMSKISQNQQAIDAQKRLISDLQNKNGNAGSE